MKSHTTRTAVMLCGATDKGIDKTREVVGKYASEENIINEFHHTKAYWREKVIRNFKTGNRYVDIMANGWLLYQCIACRLFASTSLYKAGGAYSFRDQLQTSLALTSNWQEFLRIYLFLQFLVHGFHHAY